MPTVRAFAASVCVFLAFANAHAADETQRGLKRDPNQGPQSLREIEDAAPPAVSVELPDLPAADPSRLSGQLDRVRCEQLLLEGNTVLPDDAVRAVLAPLEHRELRAEDLEAARLALVARYVEAGYVNSGVVLPDQAIVDGTIRFQAIEGRLARIELEGGPYRFRTRATLEPLEALKSRPLNLAELRAALALIERDSHVAAVRARLLPGTQRGEALLVLELDAASPYAVELGVDNHRAPSIGAEQARVALAHRSLLGLSDTLTLRYAATDGLDDAGVSYTLPLTARWSVDAAYTTDDASVIEEPFDRIDIESRAYRWRFGAAYQAWRRLESELRFALAFENERSKTELLGLPFSFAPGVVDGRAEVSVLRAESDYVWHGVDAALALRGVLNVGVDWFDATRNAGSIPDSRFVTAQVQAQYLHAIDAARGDHVVLRGELQWADRDLLPLEKYALGGADTVRGFRHNQVVRDNGFALSAEYRLPLRAARIAGWGLTLAAFVDAGRGWNSDGAAPPPQTLASAGVGVRWDPSRRWHGELYVAHGFENFTAAQHDLQDDGVHFLVTVAWP